MNVEESALREFPKLPADWEWHIGTRAKGREESLYVEIRGKWGLRWFFSETYGVFRKDSVRQWELPVAAQDLWERFEYARQASERNRKVREAGAEYLKWLQENA